MDDEYEVMVVVEHPHEVRVEVLQEMLSVKQGTIEQMRRYHLYTAHVEREVEQIQYEIERHVVR